MTTEQIIELLENKIKNLQSRLETARITGDMETFITIEDDLNETQNSLIKVKKANEIKD